MKKHLLTVAAIVLAVTGSIAGAKPLVEAGYYLPERLGGELIGKYWIDDMCVSYNYDCGYYINEDGVIEEVFYSFRYIDTPP